MKLFVVLSPPITIFPTRSTAIVWSLTPIMMHASSCGPEFHIVCSASAAMSGVNGSVTSCEKLVSKSVSNLATPPSAFSRSSFIDVWEKEIFKFVSLIFYIT